MAATKKVWVKMLTALAGADRSYGHAQRVEIDAAVAREWVKAGLCELVPDGEALGAERDGLAHTVKRLEAENAALRAELASIKAGEPAKPARAAKGSEPEMPVEPAA